MMQTSVNNKILKNCRLSARLAGPNPSMPCTPSTPPCCRQPWRSFHAPGSLASISLPCIQQDRPHLGLAPRATWPGARRRRRAQVGCWAAPGPDPVPEAEQQSEEPSGDTPQYITGVSGDTPEFITGVNWFCYSALGLLFLTDFTPLGATIQGSARPGVVLALLQWGAFVLPTLWFSLQQGYDLRKTFKLNGNCPAWLAGAAAAGPVLFLLVNAAVRLRLGLDDGAVSALGSSGVAVGPGWAAAGQPVASLLLLYVLSPAVAEELLFRGFLLTALRARLGRVDSVALSGALFAAMHLSPEQFFQYSLLGFAAGAAAVAADSVFPAMALHATYNLAVVVAGLAAGAAGAY